MSPEAVRDCRQHHLPARDHKAFAHASPRRHGRHAGAASADAAHAAAQTRCMAMLRPGDDGRRTVDADARRLG